MKSATDAGTIDAHTSQCWITQAGHPVRIRPIERHDVDRVAAYLQTLSMGARYFRFGRGDIQFSRDHLVETCNPDPQKCCRLVAVAEIDGAEVQIASAAFVVQDDGESCELEILVADQWQGTRVAHRLMSFLLQRAGEFGLTRMSAQVLGTNSRMIKFAQRHGFKFAPGTEHAPIKTLILVLDENMQASGLLPAVASGPG